MTTSLVHPEIERVLETLDGELTSHSRAFDALLDVRSACAHPGATALVDEALRSVPGKHSVATDWLVDRLRYIGLMFELTEILGAETPSAA